ncbi:lysophospholipid acyltransferase family protein [Mycoplasma nasistruthionis]|uniref:lysophospholipid acyltransferase family protein n=1 Tax=Mycoplasma nasistruthionis TaxID=353852 RepID=UPI0021CB6B14|nr:lysophospholipid acyltransferase family protein [Mycoplasma nasistruthionis]
MSKKCAINTTLKQILTSPIWLLRSLSIIFKARRYRKQADTLPLEVRYNYVLKLAKKLLKLYNVDVEVRNYDNLPRSGATLLVPNHKSNFDALALMVALEQKSEEYNIKEFMATFLAKKELQSKFLTKRVLNLIDTFYIDRNSLRESLKTLDEFSAHIKAQKTLGVIFPEGTRVKEKALGEFKSGAFRVAQKEYMTIVPVSIFNSLNADSRTKKGRQTIVINFLKPLKPSNFISQDSKAVASRTKQLIEEDLQTYED